MPTTRRRLVVMVKEPAAGRVKTRLARGIGAVGAVQFYRHATAAVLARLARHGEWETILAVAPDAALRSRAWDTHLKRMPQGRGDLGARMQRIMDRLPPGPVCIVGSDIPGIRAHHVRAAFRALGRYGAVLGPCTDGGYWLVGLKRVPRVPQAFRNVRWSSADARADTERNLRAAGLDVTQIVTLDDVDEAHDLAKARHSHRRVPRHSDT